MRAKLGNARAALEGLKKDGDVAFHADVDVAVLRPGALSRLAAAVECAGAELCFSRDEDGFQLLNSSFMLLRRVPSDGVAAQVPTGTSRAAALLRAAEAVFDAVPAWRRLVAFVFRI